MLQFFFSGGSHGFTFFLLRGIPKLLRNSLRKGMWPAAWLAFRPAASRRGAVVHGASICSPDQPWPSAGLPIRQQPGGCSQEYIFLLLPVTSVTEGGGGEGSGGRDLTSRDLTPRYLGT